MVLFVDTFTDFFAPEIGQAALRVLTDAGYSVTDPGPADLLRDHLDQHRPARRRPAGSSAAPSPS